MKIVKRILFSMLILALVLSLLAGCGGGGPEKVGSPLTEEELSEELLVYSAIGEVINYYINYVSTITSSSQGIEGITLAIQGKPQELTVKNNVGVLADEPGDEWTGPDAGGWYQLNGGSNDGVFTSDGSLRIRYLLDTMTTEVVSNLNVTGPNTDGAEKVTGWFKQVQNGIYNVVFTIRNTGEWNGTEINITSKVNITNLSLDRGTGTFNMRVSMPGVKEFQLLSFTATYQAPQIYLTGWIIVEGEKQYIYKYLPPYNE